MGEEPVPNEPVPSRRSTVTHKDTRPPTLARAKPPTLPQHDTGRIEHTAKAREIFPALDCSGKENFFAAASLRSLPPLLLACLKNRLRSYVGGGLLPHPPAHAAISHHKLNSQGKGRPSPPATLGKPEKPPDPNGNPREPAAVSLGAPPVSSASPPLRGGMAAMKTTTVNQGLGIAVCLPVSCCARAEVEIV